MIDINQLRKDLIACLENDSEFVSIAQMASKLGISRPTLYRFLNQDKPVRWRSAFAMRKYINERKKAQLNN